MIRGQDYWIGRHSRLGRQGSRECPGRLPVGPVQVEGVREARTAVPRRRVVGRGGGAGAVDVRVVMGPERARGTGRRRLEGAAAIKEGSLRRRVLRRCGRVGRKVLSAFAVIAASAALRCQRAQKVVGRDGTVRRRRIDCVKGAVLIRWIGGIEQIPDCWWIEQVALRVAKDCGLKAVAELLREWRRLTSDRGFKAV
jgi:hypothetical protein